MKKRTFRQIIKDAFYMLWNDIKSAKWVIIFIIAYFVFMKKFLYSTCPVVLISGFPCPACGLTRAGFLMLEFDFAGAFHIHPFIFPIAGLTAAFCINRYLLIKRTPEWMKWCMIVLITGMVMFYIYRMVHVFPGDPPMGFYGGSLMHILKEFVF